VKKRNRRKKKKKPKRKKMMEVKKLEKEWEIWDKKKEVVKLEEEAKKLVPSRFHKLFKV